MESYYEDIAPDRAAEYLRRNAAGRNLNQSAVTSYARDMANGHWHPTHQGIAFDEDGGLRDGQHRLAAIVKSGTTVRMLVVKGIDPTSFGVLDIGRGRTMADRLTVEGHGKHAIQLAAVARKAVMWEAGSPWGRKLMPTREEIGQFIEANPDLEDAARYAHSWHDGRTLPGSAAGFVWWLFQRIDTDDASYFMERLRDGAELQTNDAIYVLRERLRQRKSNPYGGQYLRTELMVALTIMAWNHYRRHNPITKLQLPSTITDSNFPRPI